MADNVVSWRDGDKPLSLGEPDADTVKVLEYLLEEARGGSVIGIAFATAVRRGRNDPLGIWYSSGWKYAGEAKMAIVTGVVHLYGRITKMVDED